MVNDKNVCKGLLGKIFGHKYVNILQESIPAENPNLKNMRTLKIDGRFTEDVINTQHTKYKVICIRCGKEKTQ